jgi:hypothetical protein
VCTASWLRRGERLHLFFNRDEALARVPASEPVLLERDGVRFAAPRDGRSGGTWIAVSERGLALALLNRSDGVRPPRPGSRGRLIPRLAAALRPDDFAARLLREPLRDLPGFRLAAFWLEPEAATVASWDGERLSFDALPARAGLLCSSGLGDQAADAARRAVWERRRAANPDWRPEDHRRFHRDHEPEPSAWSVCVHRPEAGTRNYAEIDLGAGEARLRCADGPPCAGAPAVEVALPLAVAVLR